ncbi:hypothetical protein STRATTON_138 [Erwinia phage vB_EamM_Stratton]|uniref:Uncharacterized protein n=1 Tax=Erwinia phage vB_EamM_Stratton TaxID=1883378 RepID=A0A1B2IH50_9CAUD|nr:hypothetical protein STRATTON_138 [Erwinia phage vB_EamM_Stratton]
MKRIVLVVIGVLAAPIFAHAEEAEQLLVIDQDDYERVFLECVKSLNGPQKTTFNDLDEAIEACQKAAREMAIKRGKFNVTIGGQNKDVRVLEKDHYMIDHYDKKVREEKGKNK